ncbi:MAG: hypothetical protein HDS92_03025 [Bacteroidales bacterium]|nr:hypothetical protein [Bacteroidales bacterium]MBD5376636.1 hypothetical protein [Bacteroides sp.]
MEPHIEHTFYTWLIVAAAVSIATIVGAMIDRVRFMRLNRAKLRAMRQEACLRKRPEDL